MQVYALLCPTRTLSLVLIRNPVEVLDNQKIVGIEPLDWKETRAILKLLHLVDWHPIL